MLPRPKDALTIAAFAGLTTRRILAPMLTLHTALRPVHILAVSIVLG